MIRLDARLSLLLTSAVLLTGFFLSPVRADGPALSAVFGIAGHYRPGGWCLVTVSIRNPGPDTISGQLQVVTENDPGQSPYGRRVAASGPSVIFARPVTVPGGAPGPLPFQLYLRGIDPAQANLTVRLVEGHDRGDGRSLAGINTLNSSTSSAFTGGPIAPNSRLLVGFGGDPGAFLFLNGLSWTDPKANPQNVGSSGMPGTLQVSEAATAADLPDRAAGYDGVDSFLLKSDAPLDGLTETQIDALKGWVMAGGHLIVCGGTDPTRFQSPFFEGLLPAVASSTGLLGTLSLTPKSLPGVHVVSSSPGGVPQIVTGPYGAGSVTFAASDPTAGASSNNAAGLRPAWHLLLSSGRDKSSSVLAMTAAREEHDGALYYYGGSQPLLSQAVMRGPSLDAPGTAVIGVFLLVYLVVLVPINYLVLKKFDRKEWAWATIPALVFLFAAGTFGVGYAAKGGSVFVNRAAIIETNAGRREAGVYAEIGLFSPHRSSYDIGLSGANMTAAVPTPGENFGRGGSADNQFSGPAQFVETPAGVTVQNASVNMWAMRAFDTQSTRDLGGAITETLDGTNGQPTGSLVNQTAYTLNNCTLFYAGRSLRLGNLPSGGSLTVPSSWANSVPQATYPPPGGSSSNGTQESIHDRMESALLDYYNSLSQNSQNYYGGSPAPAYTPAPGEAVLIGWSSDPKLAGSPPQIDGRTVTENDVTLVVVHLPVSGVSPPPIISRPPQVQIVR